MQLDPIFRDLDVFRDEFIAALDDPENRIYLDTSLLMWLVRLGSGARKEFIDWATAKNVRVPVWAAHEFHRHIVAKTELENVRKTVGEIDSKYQEFVRIANERADDAACSARGYVGRDEFVGELEQSLVRLKRMITVVEPQEHALRAVASEVVDFVNGRVMNSDMQPIISRLTGTADFRATHLMPPGFQDAAKEENPYGDVVIWEEIVADIRRSAPPVGVKRHAILISRDKKTDWVSGARVLKGPKGEMGPQRDTGQDVMLAHPLLVHEFKTRTNDIGDKLFVTLPGILAGALAYAARKTSTSHQVHQWLSSSYRPDFLRKVLASAVAGAPTTAAASPFAPVPPVPPVAPAQPHAASSAWAPREGSSNLTAKRIASVDVGAEVRAFTAATPTKQDELMQNWLTPAGGLTALKLGRLLADLAKGGAPSVLEQLAAIVETLGLTMNEDDLGDLLLGLVVPAYFDHHGDLLQQPHRKLGLAVVTLTKVSKSAPTMGVLRKLLKEAGAQLPYMPGDEVKLKWSIVTPDGRTDGPKMLKDIRVGGQSALADKLPEQSPRTLSHLLARQPSTGCTGAELRNLVSRELLIPPSLLADNFDSQKYTWPKDCGLVTLDTESEGGLGLNADNDEGESDE